LMWDIRSTDATQQQVLCAMMWDTVEADAVHTSQQNKAFLKGSSTTVEFSPTSVATPLDSIPSDMVLDNVLGKDAPESARKKTRIVFALRMVHLLWVAVAVSVHMLAAPLASSAIKPVGDAKEKEGTHESRFPPLKRHDGSTNIKQVWATLRVTFSLFLPISSRRSAKVGRGGSRVPAPGPISHAPQRSYTSTWPLGGSRWGVPPHPREDTSKSEKSIAKGLASFARALASFAKDLVTLIGPRAGAFAMLYENPDNFTQLDEYRALWDNELMYRAIPMG